MAALTNAYIPYGGAFATPFCRWQGGLASQHPLELAAAAVRGFLARRRIEPAGPDGFDGLVLGMTVPQKHTFYGAPWLAGLIGAPGIGGPTVSQACATSARVLQTAALEVETGQRECVLAVACDRTSNGPHLYYPNPRGPGGRGDSEDWVWDNFQLDPWAKGAMIETAERVAKEAGISRAEQDETCLLRHEQYAAALADDRAFQRRYLEPVEVPQGRQGALKIAGDEGVRAFTAEAIAKQAPVRKDGTVTGATQTFPADGAAGAVVCTRARAARLAPGAALSVRLLGFGDARVEPGRMPAATVPAARRALANAGVTLEGCAAVKTHNPFAVNDVYFCRSTGLAPAALNRFGSPLVYGHPQAPTGLRIIAELVEELALRGGGRGLFVGCAAGDTAMAVVLEVGPGISG